MARRKTLLDLLDEFEPKIRKAIEEALANIRSDVQMAALEAAIASGNVGAAIEAIGLDASYFRPLDEALRAAHIAGGDFAIADVKAAGARKGVKITGMFDSRNFRAEGILRQWSSDKVVEIVESTREAVREALTDAITRGTSPRSAALDLVGRVGPGGVRTGGIVGLDPPRLQQAQSVKDILGDPERIREYFIKDRKTGRMKPRYKSTDRRFDAMVRRAIKDGKALSATDIKKISTRHHARLLKARAETIARTELLGSVNAAKAEGLQQMVDSGQVKSENIVNEWISSIGEATRDSHRAARGQKRKQGEPFLIGSSLMMYPGDQSAPGDEVINCRCFLRTDIDFIAGLKESLTPEELARARAAM